MKRDDKGSMKKIVQKMLAGKTGSGFWKLCNELFDEQEQVAVGVDGAAAGKGQGVSTAQERSDTKK